MRNGLITAASITVPFMLVFGFLGMVAFATYGFELFAPHYLAFLSAFWLIEALPVGWHFIGIMLVVSMVASSCDTIQTGFTAILHPLTERLLQKCDAGSTRRSQVVGGYVSMQVGLVLNFAVAALINIPAIVIAMKGVSVLTLFVLADLLCATAVLPVCFGLWDRIHPVAALGGCFTGLLVALVVYAVNVPGDVLLSGKTPGPFEMLVKPGGLYSMTALVAFIATPAASGLATLACNIPYFLKGYKFEGYHLDAGKSASVQTAHEVAAPAAQAAGEGAVLQNVGLALA